MSIFAFSLAYVHLQFYAAAELFIVCKYRHLVLLVYWSVIENKRLEIESLKLALHVSNACLRTPIRPPCERDKNNVRRRFSVKMSGLKIYDKTQTSTRKLS